MKFQARGNGSAGGVAYEHGDVLEGDSEFARRMLVNGVFKPLDERAEHFYKAGAKHPEFISAALVGLAAELDAAEAAQPTEG